MVYQIFVQNNYNEHICQAEMQLSIDNKYTRPAKNNNHFNIQTAITFPYFDSFLIHLAQRSSLPLACFDDEDVEKLKQKDNYQK